MPKAIDRGRFVGFSDDEMGTFLFEESAMAVRRRARNRRKSKAFVASTESTWKCPQTGVRLAPGAIRNWAPVAKTSDQSPKCRSSPLKCTVS